jgi:membrane protein
MQRDHASLLAAGVAFYFFLALVPAVVVAVAVFGMVAEPADVRRFVHDGLQAAPDEVRRLVGAQLRAVIRSGATKATLGALLGAVVALWSASSGMMHLVEAVNASFDETDRRGLLRRRAIALLLTLGAFGFATVALLVIAVLPSLLADTGLSDGVRLVIGVLRWPLLGAGFLAAIALLYRVARRRDASSGGWVSAGAVAALAVWLAGSLLFSLYAANFGRFETTYGALASIVVVLLWLLLTALAIIGGAELDAELDRGARG